jgi:DNA-binding NarL/FixJ family response regulator
MTTCLFELLRSASIRGEAEISTHFREEGEENRTPEADVVLMDIEMKGLDGIEPRAQSKKSIQTSRHHADYAR